MERLALHTAVPTRSASHPVGGTGGAHRWHRTDLHGSSICERQQNKVQSGHKRSANLCCECSTHICGVCDTTRLQQVRFCVHCVFQKRTCGQVDTEIL